MELNLTDLNARVVSLEETVIGLRALVMNVAMMQTSRNALAARHLPDQDTPEMNSQAQAAIEGVVGTTLRDCKYLNPSCVVAKLKQSGKQYGLKMTRREITISAFGKDPIDRHAVSDELRALVFESH